MFVFNKTMANELNSRRIEEKEMAKIFIFGSFINGQGNARKR
jgi:hypothetical protein